jgi:hypothetical protein
MRAVVRHMIIPVTRTAVKGPAGEQPHTEHSSSDGGRSMACCVTAASYVRVRVASAVRADPGPTPELPLTCLSSSSSALRHQPASHMIGSTAHRHIRRFHRRQDAIGAWLVTRPQRRRSARGWPAGCGGRTGRRCGRAVRSTAAVVGFPEPVAADRQFPGHTAFCGVGAGHLGASVRSPAAKAGHRHDTAVLADNFTQARMLPEGAGSDWLVALLYTLLGPETWHLVRSELGESADGYRHWLITTLQQSRGVPS